MTCRVGFAALLAGAAMIVGASLGAPAYAADAVIGQIENVAGAVTIQRGSDKLAAKAGDNVEQSDTVITGSDGSAGLIFADNSLISLAPGTTLKLDTFQFDPSTSAGSFNSTLSSGTLTVKSGKITQHTPEAMTIKTPNAILGVRGTHFVVQATPAQ